MGLWSIVVPEVGKNYIKNPSAEIDLTGWSNFVDGTAIASNTRTTVWQKRDIYGVKTEKTGGTGNWGTRWVMGTTEYAEWLTGESIAFSADVYNPNNLTLRLQVNYNDGSAKSKTQTIVGNGRFSVVTDPIGGALAAITIFIICTDTGVTSFFNTDGWLVERKTYSTSYFDGGVEGCYWLGTPHNSKSVRIAEKSLGGKEINLDTYGFYAEKLSGIGMPPIELLTQAQAVLPGDLLRGFTVKSRELQFQLIPNPTSQANLHKLRKDLLEVIRPDKSASYRPFLLKYTGANSNNPTYIPVVYDAGFEYNTPNGFAEEIPLRLIAPYPYWREDGNSAYSLSSVKTLTSEVSIAAKLEGVWNKIGAMTGATRSVKVIKESNGLIYVGGEFDTIGGVANTRDIAVYNPETGVFSALSTGSSGVNRGVFDLAFDAAGNMIAVGNFSGMSGVANTQYIAKWNGSAWSSVTPLGAANASINAVDISGGDEIAVGGAFTSINGVGANRLAKLVGTTWSAYQTLDNTVNAVKYDKNGRLYVGGSFVNGNTAPVNLSRVSYVEPGTTLHIAMNGGLANGAVTDIEIDTTGRVWIVGSFTQAYTGVTLTRVGYWGGVQWVEPGGGITGGGGVVQDLELDQDGNIVVCGNFTQAGSNTAAKYVALWTGSYWNHFDIVATGEILDVYFATNGNVYMAMNSLANIITSELTTISHLGTVDTTPIITIKRTGGTSAKILWLENRTNGAILYLNYDLAAGETLTLDLTEGQRRIISSFRGEIWSALLPSNELDSFVIRPGSNQIACLVSTAGSPTIECFAQVPNLHWSADGVAV